MRRKVELVARAAALVLAGGFLTAAGSASAAETPAAFNTLPPEIKALYVGVEDTIQPTAFDNFAMPPKPWKWCHSESYQGNPWRVSVTNELKRLVGLYQEKGWVSGFEMSDSNGDTSQQIAQIRAFIDKKCSIITSFAGSSTALNEVIEAAHKAGIPFVTGAGAVTSPYAVNVDSNYVKFGYDLAKGIVDGLGGKGNVLRVEGIAGSPLVAQQRAGADKAFAEAPGIKVVRDVNGNWSPNVTKTVVLQVLATNPQPIDAVWTSGSEARIVDEAFEQAGRPVPLVSGSISGDALGYWRENPDKFKFTGGALMPSWTAQTLFRVGVRVLEGQQPKLNIIMVPVPEVKQAELDKWYASCMTKDSVSVFPVAPQDPLPDSMMDAYFVKPAPVALFDYSQTPDPCAAK
ncbi:substrate-binding domain-containing protein [Mesorhizobium sp. BAC0120]|uniref:substrate-binding domain-containing protein n=1 Tax=Mesorhizobium sp. BAC0120 TaxID=3090670 RepID=UPI00298D1211|nr:substrate-binding domain-containing protein [Mesorhizobium sp. BAC0120]MDW6024840.1 substrate-binding domain-containing protein [Mesorhizobium sp. BAC0120]